MLYQGVPKGLLLMDSCQQKSHVRGKATKSKWRRIKTLELETKRDVDTSEMISKSNEKKQLQVDVASLVMIRSSHSKRDRKMEKQEGDAKVRLEIFTKERRGNSHSS